MGLYVKTGTSEEPEQQVTILGGNANNGLNAGVTYWNVNNSSGNRNRNKSGHLALPSCLFIQRNIEPCHMAKHKTEPHIGVSREIERSEVK